MVKTLDKVPLSKTISKKKINKNKNKIKTEDKEKYKEKNNNKNNKNKKDNDNIANTSKPITKIKNETSIKNGKKKDKIINSPNKPLDLPQPSALLQIPLTGNVENLFWVLPYSTNNKLKITVHWPGIIIDTNDILDKSIIPKKPEIKDNPDIFFVLVQLFGIYKL
ncbi:hypothetical protein BCR32DRAFT_270432 [Anaeromyces robustus]|uniref:Uncharacterized protein n=1 Tax=Anaeromyces robustus TaxID=1754192 RepID=A0A1Y1WX22_9FUNG|nr:hypothetical protein BCR32DRAFT_270432 [Anaeromyces robustus]|eukprot:ORX77756.1 hypothetical protein BCR32DRAFT_270432 [Anaeromyces robustus]